MTDDLTLLTKAAHEAGEIARRYFGRAPDVWDKGGDAGPVTEADLAVNAHLEATLRAARPDYGWLSEETDDSDARQGAQRVFVIDPIDGTRAFIEESRDWGHSLAIVEDGVPVAGVIHLPMRDATYAAAQGGGATRNGQPIRASGQSDPSASTVLITRPNLAPALWRNGAPLPFKRSFRSSLAYRLCLVAEGRFDAMLTLRPTWEWDVAAGMLIVGEAGGRASTPSGGRGRFNNPVPQLPGVVAGGALHPALIDALAAPPGTAR